MLVVGDPLRLGGDEDRGDLGRPRGGEGGADHEAVERRPVRGIGDLGFHRQPRNLDETARRDLLQRGDIGIVGGARQGRDIVSAQAEAEPHGRNQTVAVEAAEERRGRQRIVTVPVFVRFVRKPKALRGIGAAAQAQGVADLVRFFEEPHFKGIRIVARVNRAWSPVASDRNGFGHQSSSFFFAARACVRRTASGQGRSGRSQEFGPRMGPMD